MNSLTLAYYKLLLLRTLPFRYCVCIFFFRYKVVCLLCIDASGVTETSIKEEGIYSMHINTHLGKSNESVPSPIDKTSSAIDRGLARKASSDATANRGESRHRCITPSIPFQYIALQIDDRGLGFRVWSLGFRV
jgi:hypothetical protein